MEPTWEELIASKVDADIASKNGVRDDMWGWEPTKERVLLVGVGGQRNDEGANEYGLEDSLAELGQLAETAGLEVVGALTQRLRAPHPGTYLGKGKLRELRRLCGLPVPEDILSDDDEEEEEEELDDWEDCAEDESVSSNAAAANDGRGEWWDEDVALAGEAGDAHAEPRKLTKEEWNKREPTVDTVVVDTELTPRQARNLSEMLDGKVMVCDRTMLILDIFSQRARTAEGQLQVEMAQLEYQLPRLTRMWTHLERQAGGAGGAGGQVKGMGEKQIEIDKRLLRDRIVLLKRKLEKVKTHRALYRGRRAEAPVPVVSLVGYTNAGKSSLLNRLTQAGVLAEDQLFATLDPTTRRLKMPNGKDVLMTDTVGFIQRLPTELVAAFRATLEEIKDSTLLLHVVDISSPLAGAQVAAVEAVLKDLGAGDMPRLTVWNKVDAIDDEAGMNAVLDVTETLESRLPSDEDARATEPITGGEDVTSDDHLDDVQSEATGGSGSGSGGRLDAVLQAAKDIGAIPVSAHTGFNVDTLLSAIQSEMVRAALVRVEVMVPYAEGGLLGEMRRAGVVELEEYGNDGTRVIAHVPLPMARRLQGMGLTVRPGHEGSESFTATSSDTDDDTADVADPQAAWTEEEEEELLRMMMEEEEAAAEAAAAMAPGTQS